jgi:hypothetical protein
MTTIIAAVAPAASASKAGYVFMSSNRCIGAQGEWPHHPYFLWTSFCSFSLRGGAMHHELATALSCCAGSKSGGLAHVRPPRQSDHEDRRAFAKTICAHCEFQMLPAWGVVRDDGRERNQSLVLPAK